MSDKAVAGSRMAATIEFLAAVHELATVRAADPGPDLISAMVTGTGEGAGLAAERIGGILIQLAIAGNETTRGAAGLGMQVLLEHPEQWARLGGRPRRSSAAAVEEILRFRPPVQYTRRTAADDAALSSRESAQTAAPGDTVYLSIASANRDPEVFEAADAFDIGRRPGAAVASRPGRRRPLLPRCRAGPARARAASSVRWPRSLRGCSLPGQARPGRGNQFIHSLRAACRSRSDSALVPSRNPAGERRGDRLVAEALAHQEFQVRRPGELVATFDAEALPRHPRRLRSGQVAHGRCRCRPARRCGRAASRRGRPPSPPRWRKARSSWPRSALGRGGPR